MFASGAPARVALELSTSDREVDVEVRTETRRGVDTRRKRLVLRDDDSAATFLIHVDDEPEKAAPSETP
ncbi:MAG: hypothetical protein U0165_15390 [Polyangiaceae bacterium]